MKPGWNQLGSTVHLDSTRDRINLRSSKIQLQLLIPSLAQGIIPFLKQFGDLYFGTLKPEVFSDRYEKFKRELHCILGNQDLLECSDDWDELKSQDPYRYSLIKTAGFWLEMMRVNQESDWQWPALIEQANEIPDFLNGRSRLIATGTVKKDPWNHIKFLIWSPHGSEISKISQDATLLYHDRDLHKVLGLEYDDQEYHQPQQSYLGVQLVNGKVTFEFFNNVYDGAYTENTKKYWQNHRSWKQRYGAKPVLKVYTDWPDLLRDRQQAWNWQVLGSCRSMIEPVVNINQLGSVEWWVRRAVASEQKHDHVLYVLQPRHIDISDLMFWTDLDHSTYLSSDGAFVLHRKDPQFRSTLIAVSDRNKYHYEPFI